jgi:acyl-CoA dehydrogenase
MAFELSPEEKLIVEAVRELGAGPNGRVHWRERANQFPERLWGQLADAGYLGLLVSEEHGGAGLGLTEMATLR